MHIHVHVQMRGQNTFLCSQDQCFAMRVHKIAGAKNTHFTHSLSCRLQNAENLLCHQTEGIEHLD